MDVDDPKQGHVDGESDLGECNLYGRWRRKCDESIHQPQSGCRSRSGRPKFSRTAEQHHGADIEVGRADADCNFDHVENGDIGDDRQTDNESPRRSRTSYAGRYRPWYRQQYEVDLAERHRYWRPAGEAHDVQTTLKVDKCAGCRDELLEIGRNGQDFVEVEADFQTRFELQGGVGSRVSSSGLGNWMTEFPLSN